MTTLYIDRKPCELPADFALDYTVSNPRFGTEDAQTLQLTLPLRGSKTNIGIFGNLHNLSIEHEMYATRQYSALLVSGKLHLSGTARIKQVTQDDIVLQFVSQSNSLPLKEKVRSLDLGTVYEETIREAAGNDMQFFDNESQYIYAHWQNAQTNGHWLNRMLYGTIHDTEAVAYPILSVSEEKFANAYDRHTYEPTTGLIGMPSNLIAPQPYLLVVLDKIMRKLGYELQGIDWGEDTWRHRICISNARCTLLINEMLPDWTIEEFLQHTALFLCITYHFSDYPQPTCTVKFAESTSGNFSVINEILDEYECEMQDTPDQELPSHHTAYTYAFDNEDKQLVLPNELRAFPTEPYAEAARYRNSPNATKARLGFYRDSVGLLYAYLRNADTGNYELTQIDFLPPFNYSEDADVQELRIMPAQLIEHARIFEGCAIDKGKVISATGETELMLYLRSSDTLGAANSGSSINNEINRENLPEAEDSTEEPEHQYSAPRSIMEVFLHQPWTQHDRERPMPICAPAYRAYKSNLITPTAQSPEQYFFKLENLPSMQTLPRIDRRSTYHLTLPISAAQPLDVGNVFYIRGKRFLCKSLKYSIDAKGCKPTIEGTFYAMEERDR